MKGRNKIFLGIFVLVLLSMLMMFNSFAEKLSGKVTIYSPHGDQILGAISDWFFEETGAEVEYLFMGGGELVERIQAEKNNPQADVIYGNPSNVFEQLKLEGLLDVSNPSWADDLDPVFVDADHYFFGTIQTPVMLFYNHDMLSEADAPKDWADLTSPRFANSLIFRSATSAASRATISALIEQFDKKGTLDSEGWEFMKAIDKNVKKYVSNSNLMFQDIAKKEASVGFWTLDGITTNIVQNKMPLTIVPPQSGAVVISDGIALIHGAKNKVNAEAFIEFAGSKEVQLRLANEFDRMPTNREAVEEGPEWMKSMDYKVMDVNWKRLVEKQSEWMQYFNDVIVGEGRVQ